MINAADGSAKAVVAAGEARARSIELVSKVTDSLYTSLFYFFLVANSNSSNYCSPSLSHSVCHSVTLCDISALVPHSFTIGDEIFLPVKYISEITNRRLTGVNILFGIFEMC